MTDLTRLFVAGLSSDIGLDLLSRLSPSDFLVGGHAHRNVKKLSQGLSDAGFDGRSSVVLKGDLSSQNECWRVVDEFAQFAGGIDAFLHLTGMVHEPQHWSDMTADAWNRDIAVNLSGPFFLAQAVFKAMRGAGGGKMIFTSTASAAHGGGPTTQAYGIAKGGINTLAKGIARAGAAHGILCNAIAPGMIDTKFHTDHVKMDAVALERRRQLVPLKRAGAPSDVTAMVLHLLGPGGDYITGQVIDISGGDWI